MNGVQSGKSIVFLWGAGIVCALSIIRFWLNPGLIKINLSVIDLLPFIIVLYILIQNNWRELENSLLFLELIGLTILYLAIKQEKRQSLVWLLLAIITGGLIQAIYGNFQLWGYFPSHHGIFKMTGSFFNPGPYSGYLAAVFPISLGLYLFNFSFDRPNSFILKLNQYSCNTLSFFKKVTVKSHFFYNNSGEKSSAGEQESRTSLLDCITMKSFFLVSTVSMCLVLPASRSRAAWLAIAVSSVYLLSIKYKLVQQVKERFETRIRRVSLLISLVVLLVIVGAGLYHFKKGSADGRLLIWKTSVEMIKDKPFWGHGYDGFKKHYMDYQAKYFESNPDSREAFVAGDSNYAFNELIQLTVEYGLVGMLILFVMIFFFFPGRVKTPESDVPEEKPVNRIDQMSPFSNPKSVEQHDPERYLIHISRAVILSVLVFGLFSYPLQILPIKICLVVSLAIVAGKSGQKEKANSHKIILISNPIRFVLRSILSVGCLMSLWLAAGHLTQLKTAHADWKSAFDLYNIGIYDDCLAGYKKAYPVLKTNGDFLTNYGKALSMAEEHENATDILQQATMYYPNTVVYTALGDSYKKMGQTGQAEQAYLHAWHMNPSRFYPKYLLAKLYDQTGQKTKAIEVATELLEKDIKIESTAIKEIKEEMKKIME